MTAGVLRGTMWSMEPFMTCQEFLARHSEYMDDLLTPAEASRYAVHISNCAACARYDRVIRQGVRLLQAAPEVEPSTDFFPRLQHRLYNLEDELRAGARGPGSSAIVSLALAGVLALLAWSPLMRLDQILLPVAGAGEDWVASEAGGVAAAAPGSASRAGATAASLRDPTPRSLSEIGVPSSIRPMANHEPVFTTPWPTTSGETWWRPAAAGMGQGILTAAPDPRHDLRLDPPTIRYYSPLLTGAPSTRATGRDTLSPPD